MANYRDPQIPDADRPGVPYYRRRTSWAWGLAALVIIIGVIAFVAWDWNTYYGGPVATGTVPPVATVPPTSAPPIEAPPPARP